MADGRVSKQDIFVGCLEKRKLKQPMIKLDQLGSIFLQVVLIVVLDVGFVRFTDVDEGVVAFCSCCCGSWSLLVDFRLLRLLL